jgi:hypothetical protein
MGEGVGGGVIGGSGVFFGGVCGGMEGESWRMRRYEWIGSGVCKLGSAGRMGTMRSMDGEGGGVDVGNGAGGEGGFEMWCRSPYNGGSETFYQAKLVCV